MAVWPSATWRRVWAMTSSSSIAVRRAGATDWRALRAIRLEALEMTPEAYGSTFADSITWADERWQLVASQWAYFLAERDGMVVGMASGGRHDQYPGTRWLYGMYVTPSARGSGAATDLVKEVGGWARSEGVTEIYLNVSSSVPRARRFYERVGFRPAGEVVVMERDPSISLEMMVLNLD